jgi:formylglycine-generating enzyme required for sulfatase activity
MWEAAYIAAGDKMEKAIGSMWNWCSNWFNYADYINPEVSMNSSVRKEVSVQLDSLEKSVRGGSLANSAGSIRPWTRASLPPQWCTPFTGVRVAIIVEN